MTYEPSLPFGITDNLAKTNGFGSKTVLVSTVQKSARVPVPEVVLNCCLNLAKAQSRSEYYQECVTQGCV